MKRIIFFSLLISLQVQAKAFLPKTFQVKFVKELKSILKKKKYSEGTLSYQYPSKIRIEQHRPFKTLYVSNGKKAWLYSAPFDPSEKGEVTVLDSRKVPIARVLDSLRGELKSNRIYDVSRKGRILTLNFGPKSQKQYQVKSVVIEMAHPQAKDFKQVKSLTVKTPNATEKYQLVEINSSVPLAPDLFHFEVTKRMKVSNAE